MRKPRALPVVYAGTYQYDVMPVVSPRRTESLASMAAVVGTGLHDNQLVSIRRDIMPENIPKAQAKAGGEHEYDYLQRGQYPLAVC